MAALSYKTIERNVGALAGRETYSKDIVFEMLEAYGRSKSSITTLRQGRINVAEHPEVEVAQKEVVYFQPHEEIAELPAGEREAKLVAAVEELKTSARVVRFKPRFLIATDYDLIAAFDTKTEGSTVFPLAQINRHFAFFLPWAGMEKAQFIPERPADTRAAEKMGKLFDELVKKNPDITATTAARHSLNIFFTRLLFCYFAEDTDLFPRGSFTKTIASHTREDGSDTATVIAEIFDVLDLPMGDPARAQLPAHLQEFPYVNGSLFSKHSGFSVPEFDINSRSMLIELGRMIWQDINPDIFGSMFQAVVGAGQRSELGQHYTSVPNILKTIEPLFYDDLRAEFDKAYDKPKQLERLLDRIGKIKIFDPACGSGNFLVIAYKQLRKLEHAVLTRLADLDPKFHTLFTDSVVKVDHFFGIEIDDFAAEVATLALWIAKHQMNREYKEKFGVDLPLIPLRAMAQIRCANATRVDWEEICPHEPDEEVYLIGNPPYVGSSMQTKEQKEDLSIAYGSTKYSKNQDYVSAWFIKGSRYIAYSKAQLAFVSTNSICQGEQVAAIFPPIFSLGLEIGYAYTSFKWANNAKGKAGVTVCVINLRPIIEKPKYIFAGHSRILAQSINGYLLNAPDLVVKKESSSLQIQLPEMTRGSMPTDGGYFLLTREEYEELLEDSTESGLFLKKYMGAAELIRGLDRYCIWVEDSDVSKAHQIPELKRRLDLVAEFRLASKAPTTREYAVFSNRFRQKAYKPTESIIVPRVSSERRDYIPIGYLGPDTVISDAAFAVYDAEPWLFAVLASRMHTVWLRAVGGKMKTDYRYSNTLVYNTFPLPGLSDSDKERLTAAALRILDVREFFYENTLAELYDPDKMPDLLREAHELNDLLVDGLFRERPFESDDDRLAVLFRRYAAMIEEEESKAAAKNPRVKRNTKA